MVLTGLLYGVVLLILLLLFGQFRSHRLRQAVLLVASYALYLTWGIWFGVVLLASTVMNFVVGRWVKRQPTAAVLWIGLGFNLALLAIFKYIPGIAVSIPVASLQKIFPSCSAIGYLVLDLSGDELPARPLSRRRPGSVLRRVRVVHGVLSGHDLRPDLPHARNAAAVSL